jgi:hypothetical protein
MDVAGWLRSLRLEQYEEKFRDNKIDADVLPQLTADDLRPRCGWRSTQAARGHRCSGRRSTFCECFVVPA